MVYTFLFVRFFAYIDDHDFNLSNNLCKNSIYFREIKGKYEEKLSEYSDEKRRGNLCDCRNIFHRKIDYFILLFLPIEYGNQ